LDASASSWESSSCSSISDLEEPPRRWWTLGPDPSTIQTSHSGGNNAIEHGLYNIFQARVNKSDFLYQVETKIISERFCCCNFKIFFLRRSLNAQTMSSHIGFLLFFLLTNQYFWNLKFRQILKCLKNGSHNLLPCFERAIHKLLNVC
jgi:hypothetical protein